MTRMRLDLHNPTPRDMGPINDLVNSLPKEHRKVGHKIMMMTFNYMAYRINGLLDHHGIDLPG